LILLKFGILAIDLLAVCPTWDLPREFRVNNMESRKFLALLGVPAYAELARHSNWLTSPDNPGPILFHSHQQLHMDYGFLTMVQYVDQ
jgi:Multicopper oxidase